MSVSGSPTSRRKAEEKQKKEEELVKLLESLEEIDVLIVAKVAELQDLREEDLQGEPNQPLILEKQKERYELEQKEDCLWKKKQELSNWFLVIFWVKQWGEMSMHDGPCPMSGEVEVETKEKVKMN